MKIFLTLLSIVTTLSCFATESVICTDRGNMKGSFYIDITGYDTLSERASSTLNTTLNFKPFRSWESLVDTMTCTKASIYKHGPAGVISCKSESQLTDFEVVVLKFNENEIVARISEAGGLYSQVPCRLTQTR